jgi:hypothetical protein
MRAFVVAGPRGPWAFATGVWRRVLGMGPPLDVVADCELAVAERARAREADREALERSRVAAGEPSDENDRALEDRTRALWREAERRCPRWDSVLPLALRGRADLAHALLGPPPPRTEQTARRLMFEWLLDLTHELSLAYHAGRDDDARRHGAIVSRVLDASGVWRASWGGEPILAELARREGPRLAPLRGDAPIAAETTAELIGLLDELAVVQPEPSGRSWREPPSSHVLRDTSLVRALAARGPEATDALLDCASNDRRLSRSLRHSSPWVVRSFSFVPVRELCALALEPRFEDSRSRLLLEEMLWMYGPDLEWQTRALAEARTATRGLSEAEIVLRFLSDDEAAQWQWANAARWMREDPDGDGPAPENAASLRGRDDARLTQLLARRARQLADDEDDTRALCQVLEAALAWDDAAAELLAAEIASCRADDDCVCGETLGAP